VVDQCSSLDRGLLQELLTTYGPCAQDDAICDVGRCEHEPYVGRPWDPAGNSVGLNRGGDAPPIRVMAHMDELSMIVKPVEPDHSLHVTQLGSSFREFSEAARSQSSGIARRCAVSSQSDLNTQPKRANGFGRRSPAGRQSDGLGARLCLPAASLKSCPPSAFVPAHAYACTAATAGWRNSAPISAATSWTAAQPQQPCCRRRDCSPDRTLSQPETSTSCSPPTRRSAASAGSYASGCLPGDLTIAFDVGRTEAEYNTSGAGGPIIAYRDADCVYDKPAADALMNIATDRGLTPQAAVLGAFEAESSHSKASGRPPRTGLLCIQTVSTDGYEVVKRNAIGATTDVLVEFLHRGRERQGLAADLISTQWPRNIRGRPMSFR